MYVMLMQQWPTPFHRSVRDGDGHHVRTLEFMPREPQFLTGDDFKAIVDDIGQTLCLCNMREDGKPLPLKPEDEARLVKKYRERPPIKPPELIPIAGKAVEKKPETASVA